ncbi:DUF3788 family protein [Hydrogenispora ethanolica]|uniref:DUF3788 family protein n=1 Tax=Hydrogenispora ethanolica TaxID=1082276 RepID=UPI0010501B77
MRLCGRKWNVKYQKSGKSLCTLYPTWAGFVTLIEQGRKASLKTKKLFSRRDAEARRKSVTSNKNFECFFMVKPCAFAPLRE